MYELWISDEVVLLPLGYYSLDKIETDNYNIAKLYHDYSVR